MLELDVQGKTATIQLGHGKVNALDVEFCTGLAEQLAELRDSDCRVIILTGQGKVFSAGVDLVRLLDEDVAYLDAFLPALVKLFHDVFFFPKPIVAAVNGHAIAGGCILACACDYRIMVNEGKIGVPELRVGVPLPNIAIETMRFVTSTKYFQPMIAGGISMAPESARAAGIVNEVSDVDSLMKDAQRVANRLATVHPEVIRITKEQLRAPVAERVARADEAFGERIHELWRDDEIRQGVAEYVRATFKRD